MKAISEREKAGRESHKQGSNKTPFQLEWERSKENQRETKEQLKKWSSDLLHSGPGFPCHHHYHQLQPLHSFFSSFLISFLLIILLTWEPVQVGQQCTVSAPHQVSWTEQTPWLSQTANYIFELSKQAQHNTIELKERETGHTVKTEEEGDCNKSKNKVRISSSWKTTMKEQKRKNITATLSYICHRWNEQAQHHLVAVQCQWSERFGEPSHPEEEQREESWLRKCKKGRKGRRNHADRTFWSNIDDVAQSIHRNVK